MDMGKGKWSPEDGKWRGWWSPKDQRGGKDGGALRNEQGKKMVES